jgi:[ribosomal protein S18]-alanine N-acetyltransferase
MSSVKQSIVSTPPPEARRFMRMQPNDLAEILLIEQDVYPFPWSQGNFLDSLQSGYENWIVRDAMGELMGYFLLMPAVDEAHLLNITVHAQLHGQGIGRLMLDKAVELARDKGMHSMLLEVRPSNHRALNIYEQYGFSEIGIRKNYYPAANGAREDAIVMRLMI